MDNISVLSYNCRGLNDTDKRTKLFLWINDQDYDIIFLQETFLTNQSEAHVKNSWKGISVFANSDSNHSRGVVVLLKENFEGKVINSFSSKDGRILLLNIEIKDTIVTVVSVYAPNIVKDRVLFFTKLKKWIMEFAENTDNVIVAGDFNCSLNVDARADLGASKFKTDDSINNLNLLIEGCKLRNLWQFCNPGKQCSTYYDKKTQKYSTLDYIFTSNSLNWKVKNIKITHPIKNHGVVDHFGLSANFELHAIEKGPGLWKLNNSILNKKDYINLINSTIDNTLKKSNTIKSWQLIWEMIKINIREESIYYCKKYSLSKSTDQKMIQKELDSVNTKIIDLEADQNLSQGTLTQIQAYKEKKSELESKLQIFYNEKAKGCALRAKVNWMREGEIPTKYFLSLEKARQSNNVIASVKSGSTNYTGTQNISEQTAKYYSELYKKPDISINAVDNYLKNITLPKTLCDVDRKQCDLDISSDELRSIIQNLKRRKSPGIDGLTYEFYQTFWNKLEPIYIKMLNETFQKKILPDSTKKALLTLLYKRGDRSLLSNYRPLSITNCDYKILTFVLANRLQKVIGKLISKDQKGYIKNKYIGQSARLLTDIIEYCDNFNQPGAILCLDFQKAFDTLNWNFMFGCLNKFGFGANFISWINIIYNQPTFCIKNNGWITSELNMHRGVRQGCAVSALLFVLAVEIFSVKLKQDENINGIKIFGDTVHLVQYADDTTLTLTDKSSVENALILLSEYSQVSGLQLNMDKCSGMWIGPVREKSNVFCNIKFSTKPLKCLGIYIGTDTKACENLKWEKILNDLETLVFQWGKRKLTLYGKVTVINNILVPKLVYPMTVLHTPLHVLKKVEGIFYSFLWGKNHKIKKTITTQPCINGGLNMTDIVSKLYALKVSWIPKLLDKRNRLANIIHNYLISTGLNFSLILRTSFRNSETFEIIKKIPMFYQQIFTSFNLCKTIKPINDLSNFDFLTQPIWGNEYFKFRNKHLYYKSWIECGITFVKDLFDQNGHFISEDYILNVLKNTKNWIVEYLTIKNIIYKMVKKNKFDTKPSKFIQESACIKTHLYSNGKILDPQDICSKDIYNILLNKKYEKPYIENMWQRELSNELNTIDWNVVYVQNSKFLKYPKFIEFKFKIIHNILTCGIKLSKWNNTYNGLCSFCGETENISHLLYNCSRIRSMWNVISNCIQKSILRKHIILGFLSNCENYVMENKFLCIVIVSYCIYSTWCICNSNNVHYKYVNVRNNVREKFAFYFEIFKDVLNNPRKENFICLGNCILFHLT